MKVLILSANTGGGHNATARALAEQFEEMKVESEMVDALALISERVSDFISRGHAYVYRRLPKLFGAGYRFEEKHTPRFIYDQCARGARALWTTLCNGFYDAVICVHVFSGMMMTEVRARYGSRTPTYFVATDYTCSPGVSELKMDGFFIPHRMLLGEFIRNGVSANRLHALGIPVGSAFHRVEDQRKARRALRLSEEGRVVLLSCGSMGCGRLEKAALLLSRNLPNDTTLVVLCGKNQKTYHALLPYAGGRLRVLPYTNQVALYMSASDVYITKPGGLTTTEAIAKGLPMIVVNVVPGLESRNYDFLIESNVAVGAKSWRQVLKTLCSMSNSAAAHL